MRTRTLGKTGIEVTELGFGAWSIGGVSYGEVEETEAINAIASYVDGGGNFIDTARRYDASESILGNYFKEYGNRENIVLCTKTFAGQQLENVPTIREDVEESLKLMGTSYIDVYYLHQPPDDDEVIDAALTELEKAKAEGLIRHIGASIKGPNVTQATVDLCRKYIKSGRVDVFQVVYSILRQKLHDVILEAQDAGVGIVARTALESGFLSGNYLPGHVFQEPDHRARWKKENLEFILEKTQEIGKLMNPPYENIAQMATKFTLANPGVSTLILGARNSNQVVRNMNTEDLPSLPEETLDILKQTYGGITERCNTK